MRAGRRAPVTVRGELTAAQRKLLERLGESELAGRFYLSGGTALSAFFLHHRDSRDLDLFSREPFDIKLVLRFLDQLAEGPIVPRRVRERFEFTVPIAGERLRVEFVHYDFDRVTRSSVTYAGLEIDSLRDIVANKLSAVIERTEPKDYVDLWFLLRRDDSSLQQGMADCRAKFGWPGLEYLLQEAFLRPQHIDAWPDTNPPLDVEALRGFFLRLSRSLITTEE